MIEEKEKNGVSNRKNRLIFRNFFSLSDSLALVCNIDNYLYCLCMGVLATSNTSL